MLNQTIKNLFLLLISFFLATCANQLPPGGGEVDKIPPEVVEVFPENGTINFGEDYFEIGFSEYVNKRSAQDAVFISPTIEGEIEYSWSGKYLRVNFSQDLKNNTTYVVTIGTDVADYNNRNRMTDAFIFTFSTGNKIDRRIVTGKIYDEKAEDVMIFAYKMEDTTANPLLYKPDYISQAGKNGEYKLMGLASGEYRIFAVLDEYRDLLFQLEQDKIGVPFTDIILSSDDTLYAGLDFFLTTVDTTSPRLISAVMTDELHILVNLSEEFNLPDGLSSGTAPQAFKEDSTIIFNSNFSFVDSASGKITYPLYAYKGNTKATEFVLVVPEKFPDSDRLFLIAHTLKDKKGNFYTNDYTSLTTSGNADTTKPKLFKTVPPAGTRDADYINQEFLFFFDDAFNVEAAVSGISFRDTIGRSIKCNIDFPDDASIKITPAQKLEPQKDYIIGIDLSKIEDAAGNSSDSLYRYKFKTISGLDFTGVAGVVTNPDFSRNLILNLEGIENKKKKYDLFLNKNDFSFERIEPGKYLLWCFYDTDSSATYSFGSSYPFSPSEEFFYYRDTLELKPRWTVTDINFVLKTRK